MTDKIHSRTNRSRLAKLAFCALCGLPLAVCAAPSVVKVEGEPGAWRLTRNGATFFVQGAGGDASKERLAALGGNSFRTWGAERLGRDLEQARANGLALMAGFWLGHVEHGFDYTNRADLKNTEAEVLAKVRQHKDDEALLCWALGNEMEMNNPHRREMWAFIDALAVKIKAIDPNHPVCTVVAEIPAPTIEEFETLAPHLDFLGINSYGGCASVGERWRKAGVKRPYMITEFGARGSWEIAKDEATGLPLEPTSTEKGVTFAESWRKSVAGERGKYCLGGYAFAWGYKVESTPTWHGMLLPDGSALASVEAMQLAWGKSKPANRCPETGGIRTAGDAASISAKDADGDRLTYKWALLSDTGDYVTIGNGLPMPEGWDDAIVEGQGTDKVKFRLPGGGDYRLYCYVFDGKGGAAYANVPLRGKGAPPKVAKKPVKLPFAVYKDEMGPWAPSGYMGNTRALKVDLACTDNPFEGETCIRVDYLDHIGWAGIFWQNPANDWGDKPGGFNLEGAGTLVFRARGAAGGEKVTFFVGGLKDKKYSDTARAELKEVELRKEWTRYRIPLDGLDLSLIKTGFGFSLANEGEPFAFFLDDIQFVAD